MTDTTTGTAADGLDPVELDILAEALRRAASTATGEPLDRALDEIGWTDAVEVAPRTAISVHFEAQGAAGATSGALDRLLLVMLGLHGEAGRGVLLPHFGTWVPTSHGADGPRSASDAERVAVHGLGSSALRGAATVVVTGRADGRTTWRDVAVESLAQREVRGLDPRLGLLEVSGTVGADGWHLLDASWDDAVARCRLALGHELVGTMRTMLSMAREHALDRVQFDRPIAAFQAVRHRLAEALVAVEAADAALDGAWHDGSPEAAAIAKAACGHSAHTVRRHCQQVLAGIGFTTEHDLHRFVRRSIVLDGILGDARTLTEGLGAAALADRHFPAPPRL